MTSLRLLLVATCLWSLAGAASAQEHFHPKGKPPSEHTLAVRAENAATLNFADERDLEEAARGFIAAPEYWRIMAETPRRKPPAGGIQAGVSKRKSG